MDRRHGAASADRVEITVRIVDARLAGLLDAWAGSNLERPAPLAFEHHGNLALRDGRWKIVSQYRAKQPRTWELYDMEQDRTEQTDLAAEQVKGAAKTDSGAGGRLKEHGAKDGAVEYAGDALAMRIRSHCVSNGEQSLNISPLKLTDAQNMAAGELHALHSTAISLL